MQIERYTHGEDPEQTGKDQEKRVGKGKRKVNEIPGGTAMEYAGGWKLL